MEDVVDLVHKHMDLIMPTVQVYTRDLLVKSLRSELASPHRKVAEQAVPEIDLAERNGRWSPSPSQLSPRSDNEQTSLMKYEEKDVLAGPDTTDNSQKVGKLEHSRTADLKHVHRIADEVTLAARSGLLNDEKGVAEMTGKQLAEKLHIRLGCVKRIFACSYDCCVSFNRAQEPPRAGCLHDFLEGPLRSCASVVILLNAIEAAMAADHEVVYGQGKETHVIYTAEMLFLAFYAFELSISLCVHRHYFFFNDNWIWNNFDALIIVQSLYERFGKYVFSTKGGGGLSFMRTFRLLRVIKALRALKFIRVFRQLRLMLESLANSISSLFGMTFMLAFIFYIVSLVIMQGVTDFLAMDVNEDLKMTIRRYFGSMIRSLISLFMCFIGGDRWELVYRLMEALGTFYQAAFLLFTMFTNVVVVNVMTGILLENVLKLSEPDPEQVAAEWTRNRLAAHEEISRMCRSMDKDRSGTISWYEFQDYAQDPRVAARFASLELDVNHAEMFFKTLACLTEKDEVSIESFIEGCVRMKGAASSIDLHILSIQVQAIQTRIHDIVKGISDDDVPSTETGAQAKSLAADVQL